MNRNSAFCATLILTLALSGCAAPTVAPTPTLPPKPTATQTLTPKPTLTPEPTETVTLQPTITETKIPWIPQTYEKPCGEITLGKPGTQSQDKTHPVLVQGTAILCAEYAVDEEYYETPAPDEHSLQAILDLDTGTAATHQADILFLMGNMHTAGQGYPYIYFGSINNARYSKWALADTAPPEPTFDECASQSDLFRSDNEPVYLCVITNAGHVSRVKVEIYHPLKISFITWAVVVPVITPTP